MRKNGNWVFLGIVICFTACGQVAETEEVADTLNTAHPEIDTTLIPTDSVILPLDSVAR